MDGIEYKSSFLGTIGCLCVRRPSSTQRANDLGLIGQLCGRCWYTCSVGLLATTSKSRQVGGLAAGLGVGCSEEGHPPPCVPPEAARRKKVSKPLGFSADAGPLYHGEASTKKHRRETYCKITSEDLKDYQKTRSYPNYAPKQV